MKKVDEILSNEFGIFSADSPELVFLMICTSLPKIDYNSIINNQIFVAISFLLDSHCC